ncbi:hypothetical protein C4D60_Mb04t12720 [Musa balbisiana]|uniref:Uncharacterized protein n=1 Tax=Musa balbisiana TaxID=52838 RepID=A0A4S8KBL7_MUSBA|nr:hypothetical protein C4D60_Mb04t12720 [Musa balbisiana]
MRDLCCVRPCSKGEQFHALSIADLPEGEPGAPYASRWVTLKTDKFSQGALYLVLAKQLYCSPSIVLMDRVTKSLVWILTLILAQEEVNRLRAKLKESRMLDDDLLTLSRDVESARSTEEALKEECLGLPKKIEEVIVEYKRSPGFELGL